MATITLDGRLINGSLIASVSEVFPIDTNIINKENNAYKKKYYFYVTSAGEKIRSQIFDNETDAENTRLSVIGTIS